MIEYSNIWHPYSKTKSNKKTRLKKSLNWAKKWKTWSRISRRKRRIKIGKLPILRRLRKPSKI